MYIFSVYPPSSWHGHLFARFFFLRFFFFFDFILYGRICFELCIKALFRSMYAKASNAEAFNARSSQKWERLRSEKTFANKQRHTYMCVCATVFVNAKTRPSTHSFTNAYEFYCACVQNIYEKKKKRMKRKLHFAKNAFTVGTGNELANGKSNCSIYRPRWPLSLRQSMSRLCRSLCAQRCCRQRMSQSVERTMRLNR